MVHGQDFQNIELDKNFGQVRPGEEGMHADSASHL
jgi:hypothetical protein